MPTMPSAVVFSPPSMSSWQRASNQLKPLDILAAASQTSVRDMVISADALMT